jgi:hypothetical protein
VLLAVILSRAEQSISYRTLSQSLTKLRRFPRHDAAVQRFERGRDLPSARQGHQSWTLTRPGSGRDWIGVVGQTGQGSE